MKNKYFWTAAILAILLGISFGALHAYSVASHKAERDTFDGRLITKPAEEIKAEYKAIKEPRIIFAKEETDFMRVYDDGIPQEVQESAEKWGEVYNICPEFIEALAYQESRFIPDIVSADGSCIGLCQINRSCHRERMKRLGVTDLTDVDQNIEVAADYLWEIFQEHDGEPETVLMIYNGDGSWEKGHVSAYAKSIVKRSEDYERIHGK